MALHHGDAYDVEVDGEWHVNACGEKEPKRVKAEWLTHEKPEPADTWEQWRRDFDRPSVSYCAKRGLDGNRAAAAKVDDLVRRAKALAERDAK